LIFYFSVNPRYFVEVAGQTEETKDLKQNEALNIGFHFLYVDIREPKFFNRSTSSPEIRVGAKRRNRPSGADLW